MAITTNESGVLYELDTIPVNESGVLYNLDTVTANEDGVLYEIFSDSAYVLPEFTSQGVMNSSSSINSVTLSGNTYTIDCNGSTWFDFNVTAPTKISVAITDYYHHDSTGYHDVSLRQYNESTGKYTTLDSAFEGYRQTGYNQYTKTSTTINLTLEEGVYRLLTSFVGKIVDSVYYLIAGTFTVTFEEV